jgi:hypothetical protein
MNLWVNKKKKIYDCFLALDIKIVDIKYIKKESLRMCVYIISMVWRLFYCAKIKLRLLRCDMGNIFDMSQL